MSIHVLASTDTEGPLIDDPRDARYQFVWKNGSAGTKLQIQEPGSDPAAWIDTDVTMSGSGVCAVWLSSQATYRVVTSSAGPDVWLQTLGLL